MKQYKPFPVGTVRGPFTCGLGTDAEAGIQYCVQTSTGWQYFIKPKHRENEAFHAAHNLAKQIKNHYN